MLFYFTPPLAQLELHSSFFVHFVTNKLTWSKITGGPLYPPYPTFGVAALLSKDGKWTRGCPGVPLVPESILPAPGFALKGIFHYTSSLGYYFVFFFSFEVRTVANLKKKRTLRSIF